MRPLRRTPTLFALTLIVVSGFVAVCFLAAKAFAYPQAGPANTAPTAARERVVTERFGAPAPLEHWTTGGPYSFTQVTELSQTLADGTHVTEHKPTSRWYRDAYGRERVEPMLVMGFGGIQREVPVIQIRDPVAAVAYFVEMQNPIVHRFALAPYDPAKGSAATANGTPTVRAQRMADSQSAGAPDSGVPRLIPSPSVAGRSGDQRAEEWLGTKWIDTVYCEGTRTTTTWAAGAHGNSAPLTFVVESWFSPYLNRAVILKNFDPRVGETTTRLTNISLTDPDASLFLPPAGYTIKDESGTIQISYKIQNKLNVP